jgi:hypothetical protein
MLNITLKMDEELGISPEQVIAHLLVSMPVTPNYGIAFDGDRTNGTTVNHRNPKTWVVSFRRNPGRTETFHYRNPVAAARLSPPGSTTTRPEAPP